MNKYQLIPNYFYTEYDFGQINHINIITRGFNGSDKGRTGLK